MIHMVKRHNNQVLARVRLAVPETHLRVDERVGSLDSPVEVQAWKTSFRLCSVGQLPVVAEEVECRVEGTTSKRRYP